MKSELDGLIFISNEKQDRVLELEAQLQKTNFEKHRLKDVIEGDNEFYNIRNIVDKIHQMVLVKADSSFGEAERVLLEQLFGNLKKKQIMLNVETVDACGVDSDLLHILHLQATFIEEAFLNL